MPTLIRQSGRVPRTTEETRASLKAAIFRAAASALLLAPVQPLGLWVAVGQSPSSEDVVHFALRTFLLGLAAGPLALAEAGALESRRRAWGIAVLVLATAWVVSIPSQSAYLYYTWEKGSFSAATTRSVETIKSVVPGLSSVWLRSWVRALALAVPFVVVFVLRTTKSRLPVAWQVVAALPVTAVLSGALRCASNALPPVPFVNGVFTFFDKSALIDAVACASVLLGTAAVADSRIAARRS